MNRKEFLRTSALATLSFPLFGHLNWCTQARYSQYYTGWEVRPEFKLEFVSLWPGWLGLENCHKLDEVTVSEWARFNALIRQMSIKYDMELVDCESKRISKIADIENTLSTYEEDMNKDASMFSKYLIPELNCLISEEWDFTYIIWHLDNGAVSALAPLVKAVGLYNFRNE